MSKNKSKKPKYIGYKTKKKQKNKKGKRGGSYKRTRGRVGKMDRDLKDNWNIRSLFFTSKEEKEEKRRKKQHLKRIADIEQMNKAKLKI